MTRWATPEEHADHDRDLRKHETHAEDYTYDCQCVNRPSVIERLDAPNSFAARQRYAERHGWPVLDCIAVRVRPEALTADAALLQKQERKENAQRANKQSLVLSLASYVSGDDVDLDRQTFLRYVRDRITDDLGKMGKA